MASGGDGVVAAADDVVVVADDANAITNANADMSLDHSPNDDDAYANASADGATTNANADAYDAAPHSRCQWCLSPCCPRRHPHRPHRRQWRDHEHCSPVCRQMVRWYWPGLPADAFAGDSGAGAHDTGTAGSSAAAPRPVYSSGAAASGASAAVSRRRTVVAIRQIADADCTPTAASSAADSTAKWRDLRHAVSGVT